MVRITPLLFAIPVLSQFIPSESTSNGLVARQSIDTNSLPSACQSSCQVINTLTNCDASLSCMCTDTIGSQLEQCMNCLVSSNADVESEAESAISGWNEACNGNLSLSGGSSSSGTTGGSTSGTTSDTTGGTTASTSPATTTGTSSSGGSSSNPLAVTGGAVGLKTGGSMAVCIVAALAGAFRFL